MEQNIIVKRKPGRPKGAKNKLTQEEARKAMQDAIVAQVREDIDALDREISELELHVASVRLIAHARLTNARLKLANINIDIKDLLPKKEKVNMEDAKKPLW